MDETLFRVGESEASKLRASLHAVSQNNTSAIKSFQRIVILQEEVGEKRWQIEIFEHERFNLFKY
jgi:uncharacterized protein Yka (UPF0111/DUF47 family)